MVVTVPLGVLKRPPDQGGIAFNPPLGPRKAGVIGRLGFGVLNKVRGGGWGGWVRGGGGRG